MGDVSKSLGLHLIWSSLSSWSFWHLFKKNRLKNETVPAKKLNFRGVPKMLSHVGRNTVKRS